MGESVYNLVRIVAFLLDAGPHSVRRNLRSPKSGKRRLEQRHIFHGCGKNDNGKTRACHGMPILLTMPSAAWASLSPSLAALTRHWDL